MAPSRSPRHPEASLYRRNAARITQREVLHPLEKKNELRQVSPLRRAARQELKDRWAEQEREATAEIRSLLDVIRHSVKMLAGALDRLESLKLPELIGTVETEQQRLHAASAHLEEASEALTRGNFGPAGAATEEAERELMLVGGQLVVTLNELLQRAAVAKEQRATLAENLAERRQAKVRLEGSSSGPDKLTAAARLRELDAAGLTLAADILVNQVKRDTVDMEETTVGRDGAVRVVAPQQLETFADVGGLDEVKEQLRSTVGAILERPDEAARYRVVHNGILFHGPPGTGKNLLSRALAGEYGMRYLRFSPATIASAYIHEAANNLRRLFELAKDSVPCVLFLDEIDTIASDRGDQPSADHREVVTQLMVCLEEYRQVSGLIICAATNELDHLDPALREGRFDAKILVPLPDPAGRGEVFRVHLDRRGDALRRDELDLEELSRQTQGYSAAAIETIVSAAAQAALRAGEPIGQAHLLAAVQERGGKDRASLEERMAWEDVVLADDTRDQLMEVLTVFAHPELARDLGVKPPAGILLHGPPGSGKTTIAKALASEVEASFYEQSAAELVSKWAGESEQRVAKLFARARANRPSVIFIDEIDALLGRRSGESSAKWEERVLAQFMRELDGLRGGEGVLLVGATNRLDIIDDAIVGRRLTPIRLGLPDSIGRFQLLRLLSRDMKLAKGVNLRSLASETEGMSGADLKRLCNAAGMKALTRSARKVAAGSETGKKDGRGSKGKIAVTAADFRAALDALHDKTSLVEV